VLDLFLFLYLFWRMGQGLFSRPSEQVNTLLVRLMIIGAFSGFFVITRLTGLVKETAELITLESGLLMTLASLFIAVILLLQIKGRLLSQLDEFIPSNLHRYVSMTISLLRGIVMSWVLLLILSRFPLGLFDGLLKASAVVTWLYEARWL